LIEGHAMGHAIPDTSAKNERPNDSGGLTPAAEAQLAWLVASAKGKLDGSAHHLLLLRFIVFNMVGAALMGVAWLHGYIGLALNADPTGLTYVIFGVFLAGLAFSCDRAVKISRDLNDVQEFNPLSSNDAACYLAKIRGKSNESRTLLAGSMRMTLSHRVSIVRHIANNLVLLGLVGTVIGFIIALSGVDPKAAADFDSISPMVSTLIQGMSTALYTTLAGAVFNVWLMVNYHVLATGTVKLINSLTEFGEAHVQS
jgi:hypothetical protein